MTDVGAKSAVLESPPGGVGARPGAADLEALLDALSDGVCLIGVDSGLGWSNRAFRSLDEATRAVILASATTAAREIVTSAGGASACGAQRVEVPSADRSRVYELSLDTMVGMPGRVAVVVRDVTASRRAEERIAAVDEAGRELIQLDADAVRKMNMIERLRVLERKIITFARELLRFDHFAVRLIDDSTGRLELVLSAGLPPEAAEIRIFPRVEGNGIAGYVAATGEAVICRDSEQDPRFLALVKGARSSLVVPLRSGDRVIGVLDVESLRPGAFGDEDLEAAEVFSRYIAMALHMLDLLVIERSTTNASISGRVEGEIKEPLEDILREVDVLATSAGGDTGLRGHIDRIRKDVESIRRRMKDVASGPQTLLGVEDALLALEHDPIIAGRRVLVADDDPGIRGAISQVLTPLGAEVIVCDSGMSAINAMEAMAAGGVPVRLDLVVSDIKMPDRNGYEVFAAARKVAPHAPVILMTGFGYDPHHSIVRASQEGLQSVLFKPFQVERLLEEIRKALSPAVASA